MDFLPILSSLRRHRTAAALIILEIALTCAIVCNAIFLIGERLRRMDRPSGIVEDEVLEVEMTGIGTSDDAAAVTQQDLAALRQLPGVKSVASSNMCPFGGSSWNSSVSTIREDPDAPVDAATYAGTADLLETLGVQLVSGRDFLPDEYVDLERGVPARPVPSIIVTRAVADTLFPNTNPLGKSLYVWGDEPQTVVGVVERLARPSEPRRSSPEYSIILPLNIPYTVGGVYLLRVDPSRHAEVLAAIDPTLDKVNPNRILLEHRTFAEVRAKFFRQDRAMTWLLVGVCAALLIITALGVIGLASFWVQQRTRQIGIRRALGATRGNILRYFQTENFILATVGIILGMALAYAINLWLMHKYQVARLPAQFLPVGALLLWSLGQIAVLGPALRASMIPPATATRNV